MSEAEVSKPAAPPKSKPGRKPGTGAKKAKKPVNHPKYTDMVKKSIESLKERGGSSRQAIHKYILAHFDVGKDTKVVNTHLKLALKRAVTSGLLKRSKGTGASGSFRLADKVPAGGAVKKATKRVAKKPASAKPKKASAKPKAAKSPAKKAAAKPKVAKAAVKKAATPKPKVAKKPKAPKKVKSPKKPKAKKAAPKKAAKK